MDSRVDKIFNAAAQLHGPDLVSRLSEDREYRSTWRLYSSTGQASGFHILVRK